MTDYRNKMKVSITTRKRWRWLIKLAITIKTHVKIINTGALIAVGIEPADGIDETHGAVVGVVANRTLENGSTRWHFDRHRVVGPERLKVFFSCLDRGWVVTQSFRVHELRNLESTALGIFGEHVVDLLLKKFQNSLYYRIVVRDVVSGLTHAPVLRNTRVVASSVIRYCFEQTYSSRYCCSWCLIWYCCGFFCCLLWHFVWLELKIIFQAINFISFFIPRVVFFNVIVL